MVEIWTCPNCDREFGQRGQGHMCKPGITIDEFMSTAWPGTREIFDAVNGRLATLEGDLIVDPLEAAILFKHGPTVVTIRSMKNWAALGLTLGRQLDSDRMSRKVTEYSGKFFHVFNLTSADEIDDAMCEWLTEAFYLKTGPPSAAGDPMVPDDVDIDF